jgi:hypothetical protein
VSAGTGGQQGVGGPSAGFRSVLTRDPRTGGCYWLERDASLPWSPHPLRMYFIFDLGKAAFTDLAMLVESNTAWSLRMGGRKPQRL